MPEQNSGPHDHGPSFQERPRPVARFLRGATALLALGLALGLGACKRAPTEASTAGSVKGTVTLAGERPEQRSIRVIGCETWKKLWDEEEPHDPAWMVHTTGGLPNTFVWAEEGPHRGGDYGEQARETRVVRIIDHYFHPRVFGAMVDQEVKIANEDPGGFEIVLNFSDGTNRRIELAGSRSAPFSFPAPEKGLSILPRKHSWIQAWAFVLDHPFYTVTDERGRFEIKGLPPGDYVFHTWHETFGESTFAATVTAGDVHVHDVTLKQKD